MSFQTDAPLPVIQSHLIIISAVAIILFMLIMFWVLYTQSIRRIKIMRKTLQQKALDLEQTKEKYRQLVEQITAVTYIDEADQHNSTIFISPQIAALSGYSAEEWKTNPKLWSNIIHPEDRNRAKKEFLLSDENNQPYKIDYRIITKGGKTVWIHDEAVRTEIEGKMVLHGVMYDITERKQLEESLRYISTHDVLTGLYNRTFFDEELNRLQKGRKFPVSVIIADIDDLKTINDKYGHARGDKLLIQAARLFESVFRRGDIVARTGGDEFVILLPETDEKIAGQCVVRIRERMQKKVSPPLHMSLGTATAYKGTSIAKIMRTADELMYMEKEERKAHQETPSSSKQIPLLK